MSVRSHIVLMLIATMSAWISWLLVLTTIDPTTVAWWGFLLFYVTLFLSLFGSLTIVGVTARTLTQLRRSTISYKLTSALRQSFLWTLAVMIALGLQSQRLLTWWVVVILIIIFVLIEFFMLTVKQKHSSESYGQKA